MRERLSSRLGFILLSAGCAIGLGNVWRFPYVVGQAGGGWFFPFYLLALMLVGVPVLTMEFAVGRASQRSLAKAHGVLTPERKAWRIHGVAGFCGCLCLMIFYTTVAGWMLIYFWKTIVGDFVGLDTAAIGAVFSGMLARPGLQAAAMAGVSVGSALICMAGLRQGLERVSKWMMLALLVLIAFLAANSIMQKGAMAGLKYFLAPDLARLRAAGVMKVATMALNQAFFTLSLGVGAMAIFGSYIGRERSLLGEAAQVTAVDTLVALAAGLIILPACFAFGVEPGQGPGLVFVTLPQIFNHMPCGRMWGAVFFVFMAFAALTTVLAVFEALIAGLMDYFGWTRRRAGLVVAFGVSFLSLPCVFGFNLWSSFQPLGAGTNVLDLEDFILSNILLPLGSLGFALYCTRRFGWGWEKFCAEANAGEGLKIPAFLRGYCAYGVPAIILIIFLSGLCRV